MFLLSGYSTDPSAFLTGLEYKTLNKPCVSMLGVVLKKLKRKKPPNMTKINTSGKLRPISENDNKSKYILGTTK
mgnify:CR=1 FL=1